MESKKKIVNYQIQQKRKKKHAWCTQFIWFKAYPCQDLTLHYKQQVTTIFYLSFITQFEVTHQTWRNTSYLRELYKTQTHHNEFFQTLLNKRVNTVLKAVSVCLKEWNISIPVNTDVPFQSYRNFTIIYIFFFFTQKNLYCIN